MWKYGIILAIVVILISIASLIVAVRLTRKVLKNSDTKLAEKQTIFVFSLIMAIYLIPIVAMSISIFYDIFTAIYIGYAMVFLTIPVVYLIIIPLSDKKKLKYVEEMYGKDSEYAKYLRKKHKKELISNENSEKGN